MAERIYHKGVPIDNLSDNEALYAMRNLQSQQAGKHIITLTPDMYVEARQNRCFNRVLREAWLVLPESSGLKYYSLLVPPNLNKISGGMFFAREAIHQYVANAGKVALVGSTPENRILARESLCKRFNTQDIITIDGEYDFNNSTDSLMVAGEIDTLSPDFVVMAGAEVQAEMWINYYLIKSGVSFGVVGNFGQTIDYEAGNGWCPPPRAHKFGLGWITRIPTLSPERRKTYIVSRLKLLNYLAMDMISDAAKMNISH